MKTVALVKSGFSALDSTPVSAVFARMENTKVKLDNATCASLVMRDSREVDARIPTRGHVSSAQLGDIKMLLVFGMSGVPLVLQAGFRPREGRAHVVHVARASTARGLM